MICRFGGQISPWLPVGEQSPSRKAKVQPLSEFAGKAVLCRKANKPSVFTTIDPPDSQGSEVTTIDNNGLIIGDYVGMDGASHGFIGTPTH